METGLDSAQYDVEGDVEEVKKAFWPKVAEVAGRVPFVPDAVAMYYALLDLETPFWVKGVIASTLLYFIAPLDTVPDFLAAAGYADDATLLFMTARLLHEFVKPHHVEKARELLQLPHDDDFPDMDSVLDDGEGEPLPD